MHRRPHGPQHAQQRIAEVLEGERAAGRLRADADPRAAAVLLSGACHVLALGVQLSPALTAQGQRAELPALVRTVLTGLQPT